MFKNYNKRTTLVGDADNGRGCAYVEVEGLREIIVLSAQFCCEPETALKKSILKTGKRIEKDTHHRKMHSK